MSEIFFEEPSAWRQWLSEHHESETSIWVGFYKKGSRKPSLTWPESVDEALCYGWIDGLRKGIDQHSYKIRFTPRKKGSIWSSVNIGRVHELEKRGLMMPSGLNAYQLRKEAKSEIYAYEQEGDIQLNEDYERQFQANECAWRFFQGQAAGYKKTAIWWVISARREETRLSRLATLIDDCAEGRKIGRLTYDKKPNKETNQ